MALLFAEDNEDDEYDENREEKLLRRRNRDRSEKDRPLPPLLARVGGAIEVRTCYLYSLSHAKLFTDRRHRHYFLLDKR